MRLSNTIIHWVTFPTYGIRTSRYVPTAKFAQTCIRTTSLAGAVLLSITGNQSPGEKVHKRWEGKRVEGVNRGKRLGGPVPVNFPCKARAIPLVALVPGTEGRCTAAWKVFRRPPQAPPAKVSGSLLLPQPGGQNKPKLISVGVRSKYVSGIMVDIRLIKSRSWRDQNIMFCK